MKVRVTFSPLCRVWRVQRVESKERDASSLLREAALSLKEMNEGKGAFSPEKYTEHSVNRGPPPPSLRKCMKGKRCLCLLWSTESIERRLKKGPPPIHYILFAICYKLST